MTSYRCRLHPDQHTTWKGTGCPECAPHQPRASARQQRQQRRQALDEAYERITGGAQR